MSVPLDRLYHFLDGCTARDLIIYRWFPHGSRKIADLKPLKDYWGDCNKNFSTLARTPIMICHDQEPLHFDLYTSWDAVYNEDYTCFLTNNQKQPLNDHIRKFFEKLNLRAATDLLNLHDKVILLHSEVNGHEIDKYQQHGFLPVYYFSHAMISMDWFRYAQVDPVLHESFKAPHKEFLIYNRSWSGTREYRLYMANLLVATGLVDHCLTSFNPLDQGRSYRQHQFCNSEFDVIDRDLEKSFAINKTPASASADYVTEDYACTGIEIVLETLFDDARWHLTEKTFRPIACGRPFILASTAGSLQYLKCYGFETFDSVLDESYDAIQHPITRLQAIIEEMIRFIGQPKKQKQEAYLQLYQIAARNRRRFFSENFQECVLHEYRSNLARALCSAETEVTGQLHKELIDLKLKYQPMGLSPNLARWHHDIMHGTNH